MHTPAVMVQQYSQYSKAIYDYEKHREALPLLSCLDSGASIFIVGPLNLQVEGRSS